MKYILMMSAPLPGFEFYNAWPKEHKQAHMAVLNKINEDLMASGEFVSTEGLEWPGNAKVVRGTDQDGRPVTDGVFPESKEFLAGFWIVEVASPERAYEIAARISTAPGPGGVPTNMPMEVRQVVGHWKGEAA